MEKTDTAAGGSDARGSNGGVTAGASSPATVNTTGTLTTDTVPEVTTNAYNVVTNTATVTITGGDTSAKAILFDTYQVIYATYVENSNSFDWHLTDWADAALAAYNTANTASLGLDDVLAAIALGGTTTTTGKSTTEQSEVVNILAAYISTHPDTKKVTQGFSTITAGNIDGSSATLSVGSYLVIAKCENMSFLNMMVSVDASQGASGGSSDWTLSVKSAVLKGKLIGITKEVSDDSTTYDDGASVGIGDIVYYAITADVPQFPANSETYEFKITDTPENVSIDESSVLVYGVNSSGEKTLLNKHVSGSVTGEENYKIVDDVSGEGKLIVDFSDYYKYTFYSNGTYTYKFVYITYSAKVLSSALIATGNENTAELSYGSSYTTGVDSNTAESKTKVYTYGAVLTKYDDDNSNPTVLANATFQISYGGTVLKFVEDTTSSTKVYRVADADDTNTTTDITTGTDGTITIIGLDAGKEYKVAETKAPSGYSLNTNYITFTITGETDVTSGALTGNVASVSSKEYTSSGNEVQTGSETWSAGATDDNHTSTDAYMYMSVTDTTLGTLPATGSIGIIVFTIAGVAIMILALILINGGKSKEKAGQGMRR